ncbi:hypothetical protein [Alteromonas macleodii]|uniref:Uncharacterized protein n=1 Tax=Alteromonas macleodii TaxID=28108 RepID=A0AB36FMX7_ALTMA|nr:hypothetical protein [Alteromonas macleodii]OES24163.1 hypothetical protein BFV93_4763 [Alteromonas macleodii]OES24797.1 hypothetical protein BFV95_4556 [Alteromonas macleodii]OES25075.1 hypothetical protein BFV94_4546 [Alteromonas macleodii]OES39118.1 hypothetical protein BFV96_4266 [Alteromonas macleodii]
MQETQIIAIVCFIVGLFVAPTISRRIEKSLYEKIKGYDKENSAIWLAMYTVRIAVFLMLFVLLGLVVFAASIIVFDITDFGFSRFQFVSVFFLLLIVMQLLGGVDNAFERFKKGDGGGQGVNADKGNSPAKEDRRPKSTDYRFLKDGEAFFPGDEFETADGKWQVLTQAEYDEWSSFRAHFYQDEYENGEMSRFRRKLI